MHHVRRKTMNSVMFIRHSYKKERQFSGQNDIFAESLAENECYQDLVSYSNYENDSYIVNTIGKHVFPQNYSLSISMQRWMILLLVDGELRYGSEKVEKGDFVVIPSSCAHEFYSEKKSPVFYWCTTNNEMLTNTLLCCGYRKNEVMRGHLDDMGRVTELFENTIYKFPMNCDHGLYLTGWFICLFSNIAANIVERQKISDQLFLRCLNRIESKQGNITVDELAKNYFISRRYLYSMFKEYKNMSPFEYILSVRMQAADKYLTSTNWSIAEIAELTGYSNYSHFTRAYLKYYSISPSERRKQAIAQSILADMAEKPKPNSMQLDE